MDKTATTEYPIMAELASRWSPRAFDPDYELSEKQLGSLFEAARWSPSSSNSQPWQFIVGLRGTELFRTIHQHLASGNQVWTGDVSALVVNVVETENVEGKALSHASYDLGQAVAHLSVQASNLGLVVHQMGGFDREGLKAALGLDSRWNPFVVMAIGVTGNTESLPENLQERERATRQRKPLSEVAPGVF